MLEALAFFMAEQIVGGHFEPVESDLIFLHAAIAEHADLAAAHAFGRENFRGRAARLLREKHRKSAIARHIGVGAHQKRHHIGACRVRDPGLVAVDLVNVAILHRAGAQIGHVRSAIGFCEDGSRQFLAACDQRQPVGALFLGAAGEDEFGRDLRTRGKGAHADIAA